MALEIELAGESYGAVCDCCGNASRKVWRYVGDEQRTLAAYFVHWTVGHIAEHGANFDLIVGQWGNTATREAREGVSVCYRLLESGPSFMVIDASTRPFASSDLFAHCMGRNEVVGTPVAAHVFAICDEVLRRDHRVGELLGDWQVGEVNP